MGNVGCIPYEDVECDNSVEVVLADCFGETDLRRESPSISKGFSALIIPCYNESKNLPLLLSRCKEINSKEKNIEIIIVDNGSTDETSTPHIAAYAGSWLTESL